MMLCGPLPQLWGLYSVFQLILFISNRSDNEWIIVYDRICILYVIASLVNFDCSLH